MLGDFSLELRFVLCCLATWRLTHMIVSEDGPWDVIVRMRAWFGDSVAGRAMDCFYCISLWVAILFAFMVGHGIVNWFLTWLAISGAASLLEQATNRELNRELSEEDESTRQGGFK